MNTSRAPIRSLRRSSDEPQDARELDLLGEGVAHLDQGLELTRPARRGLVQTRVLDRDGRLRREERDDVLVLLGELAVGLLGQVQVPVGDAAEHDRHPQERRHRRVVRREADRVRMLGEAAEAQGLRVADEHSEDAAPARTVADLPLGLLVDAGHEEALEACPGGVDHTERRVARAGQPRRRLHDPLEHGVEGQLGRDDDARLDELPEPRLHARIIENDEGRPKGRPSPRAESPLSWSAPASVQSQALRPRPCAAPRRSRAPGTRCPSAGARRRPRSRTARAARPCRTCSARS